jgi:hypothetical protein
MIIIMNYIFSEKYNNNTLKKYLNFIEKIIYLKYPNLH